MRLALPPASQSQRRRFAVVRVQADEQVQRPAHGRRGGRVPVREPQRERVEQDVDRARRVGAGRRGARGCRRLPHAAGPGQVTGENRGPERLQVRLAGQRGVERLEQQGRAEQEPGRVASATLVEGDLAAQALLLCGLQRVQRPGHGRGEQPKRRVQRAGVAHGPGGREQPLRPAGRVGVSSAARSRNAAAAASPPRACARPADRSSSAATSSSGQARPGPGARLGDPGQPPGRWPPPARACTSFICWADADR